VEIGLTTFAAHNLPNGMNNFGLCLEFGKGIAKDLPLAAQHYKSAADIGFAEAQNNFAFCLRFGVGVDIDLTQSTEYYKRSAAQRNGCGAFHYALSYHYGIGIEVDLEEAAKYYDLAAELGHGIGPGHRFRCLRSQNKAIFRAKYFSSSFSECDTFLEHHRLARPSACSTISPCNRLIVFGRPLM
jgi:TPR repeat protein